jgi:hypothetical protein
MCPSGGRSDLREPIIPSRRSDETSSTRLRLGGCLISLQTLIWLTLVLNGHASAQTSSTGALLGVVVDASGAILPDASVEIRDQDLTDLPHFRCRVKLRLKHPKAALALSEARNLPAHTFAA